jgi:hypothetical protein
VASNSPKTSTLIEDVLRLRRAARTADESAWGDIQPVLEHLGELIGPTVSRAEAARLLGISYTALDRWINKGDISSVLTPRGRREVPVSQLLDLLEEMETRREEGRPSDLASVMRARRRRANEIDIEDLLPHNLRRRSKPRRHRAAELNGLLYHRLVAQRLDDRLVEDARRRLERWREDGRIHPRWADEWRRLLTQSLPKIAKTISADTEVAQELRQTSPFAGVLTEQERRRLNRTVEERVVG